CHRLLPRSSLFPYTTLFRSIGFSPVGFARSSAGEYAGNIFWIVGFSLIASWIVAVVFTPYLGVKLLPEIKAVKGESNNPEDVSRSEEHTSELQSRRDLVCRL